MLMIDAEKLDQSRSTSVNLYSALKVQYVYIGRDHEGKAAGRRGACACRCAARKARWPAQRTGGNRACARPLRQRRAKGDFSQNADYSNKGGHSIAASRAFAHCDGRG